MGNYNNADELYHYGVKGMKWGVRRYQRTDGSLTAAGKRRYSDKEISDYRKRKISEAPTKAESPRGANKGWYRNAPKSTLIREMRREEAEALKEEKKVNTKKDSFVLKKGTTLHRSTYNADESDREGHIFATFKGKDAKGYASRNKFFSGGKKTFDMTMTATEDLISPSKKERVDTFIKLMMSDPKFNEAYRAQKQTYQLLKNPSKAKKIEQTVDGLKKEYDMFAVSLGGSAALRDRYFAELNKKGYNMIIDDADAGIISNSPVIIFDRQKSLKVVSINEVNREYLRRLGKQ